MQGFNRVFILGYLGSDPERLTSKTGKTYLKLSVSTHYNKRNGEGVRESNTTWHKVKVFGKTAETCETFLHKGSPVAVEGYLSRYDYNKEDGTKATAVDVVAQQVQIIGRKEPSSAAFLPAP